MQMEDEVRALLADGQKIAAVKVYRDRVGCSLREAKDAVEAMQAGGAAPHAAVDDPYLESELLSLLGRGEKLKAIELYRQKTNRSLSAAKQSIEALATRHGIPTQSTGRGGVELLVGILIIAAAIGVYFLLRGQLGL